MNQSVLMPVAELLQLKEGEKLTLLEVFLMNKGSITAPQLSLGVEVDSDYIMLIAPFVQDIVECLKESLLVTDIEKLLLKHANQPIPFAIIHLFADENGFNIGSRFYQIEEDELIQKGLQFYVELNNLLENVIEYVNKLTEEYAIMNDNDEIYSPREFQFMYRQVNGEWKYDSFVRMTDRLISQQKQEIRRLLDKEIEKKLLEITNAKQHIETPNLMIKFYSDGLSVNDIEVAGY